MEVQQYGTLNMAKCRIEICDKTIFGFYMGLSRVVGKSTK